MFGTLLCAAPALQLKAWESLQTKTAAAAAGYTLRDGLVPSSAPQATIPLVPHGDVDPETILFYRDTNAWCPFCERVYLYLLESNIEHEQTFVDISPGKKPEWYTKVVPTGQTPSLSLGGKPVWESIDIIEAPRIPDPKLTLSRSLSRSRRLSRSRSLTLTLTLTRILTLPLTLTLTLTLTRCATPGA